MLLRIAEQHFLYLCYYNDNNREIIWEVFGYED